MALFQTSVLKTYLAQQDTTTVERAYKKYTKYFHNVTIQENIKNSKEEQYQAKFLDELFVNVLDYTLNPKPAFNITTEFKNQQGAGKADGAILNDEKAIGVIELKGTNTKDLESIRKQAFDYKANQKGCVYVITSNFEKLRFYINDATEFLEFNLFQLAPDEFALLYLCLQKDNVLKNLPLNIKEASLIEEENITKQFYSDYSLFKRELFRDLVKRNAKRLKQNIVTSSAVEMTQETEEQKSLEKNVKLSLFKKSQKLIDRFLFIFFAEDRDLLPPNSTIQILDKWKADIDFGDERPLYNLFKQYFHFLDEGRKGTTSRAEIYAYNGGLFKPDAILDNLQIDDELLYKHTYKLAKYDFSSQVDVNILGHIFENSLNEIESVNAEIEGGEFDKQKSKRKKDGVFYTPKYITKYIVENTVGKLCQEKKEELSFKEEEYFEVKKGTHQNTKKQLLEVLETYRDWLLQITICDPACGSGAFLNQALDFLIKEHRYIDELKSKVLGGGLILSDIENTILENNIYGVDLNEESVEIAKLSLWLRTAQPRRKLNDLSNNIKCGNSLIDSKTVAGDKAFNWQEQFPHIFDKGGFDVVIGNPPYVRQELLDYTQKKWLSEKYQVGTGAADLYIYFYDKGINLLKQKGVLGFITPNKFIKARYGTNLRNYLSQFEIIRLIDFGELPVFSDASTFPLILILSNTKVSKSSFQFCQIVSLDNKDFITTIEQNSIKIMQEQIQSDDWNLIDKNIYSLLCKLKVDSNPLREIYDLNYGIKTGYNEAFIINKKTREELIELDINSQEIIKPFLKGTDVRRNYIDNKDQYLIFTRRGADIEKYSSVKSYLQPNKDRLTPGIKGGRKKGDYKWFEIQDTVSYHEEFEQEKIIFPVIAKEPRFVLDREGYYFNDKAFMISGGNIVLCTLLNSKLIWFFLKNTCSVLGDPNNGGRLELRSIYMNLVPIKKSLSNYPDFDTISSNYEQLDREYYFLTKKMIDYFSQKFFLSKISRKLENWYELEFGDFIKELNKAIKKAGSAPLTKKDEFEWLELFEENKKKAQELQAQITQTEKEIDTMVYELYGLTDEEIAIVENS
mgnify:CR=1 FL=1